MLFYLTNSLIVPKEDPDYHKIFSAVRNLVVAASQGKHEVTADFETLSSFEEWFTGDYEVGGYLKKLQAEYSTSLSPSVVSYYIKVVKDVSSGGEDGIGVMSFGDFLDNDRVAQTSLIGENDYDCQFFAWILRWYKQEFYSGWNLPTSISFINGAGGSTPSAIVKELEKEHVSVCIVDTDIRFPGDRIKNDSTCKKCRRVVKKVPFFQYLELDVHEIENIIPLNYIEHIDGWNGESGRKKKAFDYICSDPLIMRYYDFKKGIMRSNVIGDDYYLFGKRCYEHNPEYVEAMSYEDFYQQSDKPVYPGLNEQALKHTLDYLDNNGMQEAPVFLEFQRDQWIKIGDVLLSFCIAHNREAIY